MFKNPNIEFRLYNLEQHPQYSREYFRRLAIDPPPVKPYPKVFKIKFKDGNRDNFLTLLQDALKAREWEKVQV